MRNTIFVLWLVLLGMALPLSGAKARQPQAIYYQGGLTNANGEPMPDGSYTLVFTFYDASDGGNKLWEEKQQVDVQGGDFTAVLGKVIPLSLSFEQPYWLSVKLENGEGDSARTEFSIPAESFDAH